METKNFLDELLTNDVFVKNSNGKKSSIYKRELFAGLLDDDKKKLRRKLRKTLQNKFLATFLTIRKNETELKKLSKIWIEYVPELLAVLLRAVALPAQLPGLLLRLLTACADILYFLAQLRNVAVDVFLVKPAQAGAKHALLLQTVRHPFAKNGAPCCILSV